MRDLWQLHNMSIFRKYFCRFSHCRKSGLFLVLVLTITGWGMYRTALAATEEMSDPVGSVIMDAPFQDAYWGLEVSANSPNGTTKSYLRGDQPQISINYSYLLSTGWMLRAQAGFRHFLRINESSREKSEVSILSAGYESLKSWRIYHPFYLFSGMKLQYFLPTDGVKLPLHRDDQFSSEFGAGAVLMLTFKPEGDWMVSTRIERWRGIKTTRLQGTEVSIGIATSLKALW